MDKVKQLIVEHPLLAVGGALAAGALLGFGRPRGRIAGALSGAIGAIAIGVLRDVAIRRVAGYARSWIDETERKRASDVTAKNREVEAFLEH